MRENDEEETPGDGYCGDFLLGKSWQIIFHVTVSTKSERCVLLYQICYFSPSPQLLSTCCVPDTLCLETGCQMDVWTDLVKKLQSETDHKCAVNMGTNFRDDFKLPQVKGEFTVNSLRLL